jgi:hypothetical protein
MKGGGAADEFGVCWPSPKATLWRIGALLQSQREANRQVKLTENTCAFARAINKR